MFEIYFVTVNKRVICVCLGVPVKMPLQQNQNQILLPFTSYLKTMIYDSLLWDSVVSHQKYQWGHFAKLTKNQQWAIPNAVLTIYLGDTTDIIGLLPLCLRIPALKRWLFWHYSDTSTFMQYCTIMLHLLENCSLVQTCTDVLSQNNNWLLHRV